MKIEGKIVVEFKPDYVQAEVAKALCGIPKPTLMRICAEGKVRSRRLDDDKARCNERTTRVYRYSDILEWIETTAIDPVATHTAEEVA
jgi:hypothetical protein